MDIADTMAAMASYNNIGDRLFWNPGKGDTLYNKKGHRTILCPVLNFFNDKHEKKTIILYFCYINLLYLSYQFILGGSPFIIIVSSDGYSKVRACPQLLNPQQLSHTFDCFQIILISRQCTITIRFC